MDDSAQDSGTAMYRVARDLPIIVRYRAGNAVWILSTREGSMSSGHGPRRCCDLCWQHKSCQLHPIMDTEEEEEPDRHARWKHTHHLWLPAAGGVGGGRDGRPLSSQHRSHHRRGVARRGCCGWPASKAKRRPLFLLMKEAGTELMGAWNWPFRFFFFLSARSLSLSLYLSHTHTHPTVDYRYADPNNPYPNRPPSCLRKWETVSWRNI
jgi:hypothetical protein